MSPRTYSRLAAVVFAAVAVMHGVRAVESLPVTVGSTSIPVGLSWVAVVVAGALALLGLRARD